MAGNMFAGTDEAPGEKFFDGKQFVKHFYGMGSQRAMKEGAGALQRYLHQGGAYVAEGVESQVPYKGSVMHVLDQLAGGLRKTFHYVGARNLAELHDKADFFEMSAAGIVESHPHDVQVVAPAPTALLRAV
jgi:IMP dehydrogenase